MILNIPGLPGIFVHLTHLDVGKNIPERSSNQPDGRAENSLGHLLDLKVATLSMV